MPSKSKQKKYKKLKPLPIGLVRVYGLIAIIGILIPEWIAEKIISMSLINSEEKLPHNTKLWEAQPDLLLSTMSFRELRHLAMKLRIKHYASKNKSALSKRILSQIHHENLNPFHLHDFNKT